MRIAKPELFNNQHMVHLKTIKNLPKEHRFSGVLTDKDKIRVIKSLERMVRSSMEYKHYVSYLREYVDMTKCRFYKKVNNSNRKKVSIEIHHEPFTLFDITKIVLEKWIAEDKEMNHFLMAEEVMKIHYQDKVGLIPLSITVHELVHEGKIFIPLQDVYGKRFVDFVREYEEYIDDDLRSILNEKIAISKDIEEYQDLSILERKYLYIEVEGFSLPNLDEYKIRKEI